MKWEELDKAVVAIYMGGEFAIWMDNDILSCRKLQQLNSGCSLSPFTYYAREHAQKIPLDTVAMVNRCMLAANSRV